jgi:hypothetical protein
MESSGYHITPTTMESRQCIKILPPDRKHDHPRRCGGLTTPEDLAEAQRLSSILPADAGEERIEIIKRIILLRVCKNTHRRTLEDVRQSSTFVTLVTIYEKSLVMSGIVQSAGKGQDELFEPFHAPKGQGIAHLLPQDINSNQYVAGSIYVFKWPRVPGLLKIGYAKKSTNRINTWQHCHPEATLIYERDFAFPERMEKLVHAELADTRRRLRVECSRCGCKHTEWFEVSLEEAKRVIDGWHEIASSPLYTTERKLSRWWSVAVQSLLQVTMASLLRHLQEASAGKVCSTLCDAEARRTASSRPPVATKSMHSPLPLAPQTCEYCGVDELVTSLASTEITSSAPQDSPARIPPT